MKKTVNYISASDLVNLTVKATEAAISGLLASLGVVQVAIHPETMPHADNIQARVAANVAQAQIVVPRVKSAQARTVTSTREVPKGVRPQGDYYCKVNVSNAGEVVRTKLPMGLFEGFSTILLRVPNVAEDVALNCDMEGRSRISVGLLDAMGARPGSFLVFDRIEPGVFQVSLMAGETTAMRVKREALPKAQTGDVIGDLAGMFADSVPTRQAQPASTAVKEKRKDNPTQAQLDARARFAARYGNKAQATKATQARTNTTREEARAETVRPQYVTGTSKPASVRPAAAVVAVPVRPVQVVKAAQRPAYTVPTRRA